MILEPVLGEGGYIPAPRRFIEGVVALCQEHGILFIADEVQSGFGRTGRMFAIEHYDVVPDIICMAKGIASGSRSPRSARPRSCRRAGRQGATGGRTAATPSAARRHSPPSR